MVMIFMSPSVRIDISSCIAVVETTQYWRRGYLSPRFPGWPWIPFSIGFWNLLTDTLMRPGAVVIIDIFMHRAIELAMVQDKHRFQALTPQTANETFTI
jgi:hypothetical protein